MQEKARGHRAEYIVLNVMLPGSDGYALAKKLKSGSDTKDTSIGFVSAKNDPVEVAEGFHCCGANPLTNPATVSTLKTEIDSLLRIGAEAASGGIKTSRGPTS